MNRSMIVIATAWLALAACSDPVEPGSDEGQLVRVTPAEYGRLTRRMSFSATLQPVHRARLAFQSGGVLATRPVHLGSAVRAGELLATLDNPELGPAQRAAAAALQETMTRRDQARRDLDRLQSLLQSGVVGEDAVEQKQAELDTLEAALDRARADLSATRQRLEDASLVAPFDGVISMIDAEPGEFVAPGQPILGIGAPDRLELEVLLPASLAGQVRHGEKTRVSVPQLPGDSWTGAVTELSAIGDRATGLFPVVVEVESEVGGTPLRAGMLARASFEYLDDRGFIVPLAAIVDPVGGNPRIYVVESGRVRPVPVEIVASAEARVAVEPRAEARMSAGDLVVTEGHRALTEGQQVRTLP